MNSPFRQFERARLVIQFPRAIPEETTPDTGSGINEYRIDRNLSVIERTNPQHKLRIVSGTRGEVHLHGLLSRYRLSVVDPARHTERARLAML
jgi:hypothetical protein